MPGDTAELHRLLEAYQSQCDRLAELALELRADPRIERVEERLGLMRQVQALIQMTAASIDAANAGERVPK